MTTQNQWLQSGLDPADKGVRVMNYSLALERDLQMITHACGLHHPSELHRGHVVVNISPGVRKSLLDVFPYPQASLRPRAKAAGMPTQSTLEELERAAGELTTTV